MTKNALVLVQGENASLTLGSGAVLKGFPCVSQFHIHQRHDLLAVVRVDVLRSRQACAPVEGLICGQEEAEAVEGHTHSAECYVTESVQICELEQTEGHVHGEDCYNTVLAARKSAQ